LQATPFTERKAVVTLQPLSCYHTWQKPKVTNQICAFQRSHPLSLSSNYITCSEEDMISASYYLISIHSTLMPSRL